MPRIEVGFLLLYARARTNTLSAPPREQSETLGSARLEEFAEFCSPAEQADTRASLAVAATLRELLLLILNLSQPADSSRANKRLSEPANERTNQAVTWCAASVRLSVSLCLCFGHPDSRLTGYCSLLKRKGRHRLTQYESGGGLKMARKE